MDHYPLPVHRIEIGRIVPVDIWDARHHLLMRKGQAIISEQHQEHLLAHQACVTETDFNAWNRAFDRVIYAMLRDGVSIDEIAKAKMPDHVCDIDYVVGHNITGSWLDIQAVLTTVLHPAAEANAALEKLEGIQRRVAELLAKSPDDSLYTMFQALADPSLGYSATHALLCAVACELTAHKLGLEDMIRPVLMRAALTMNIGMAREQDALAQQYAPPDTLQRALIRDHPQIGAEVLRRLGEVNDDVIDIVTWHHDVNEGHGMARNLMCRRLLHQADIFVAKMAARATRNGISAIGAAKAGIVGSTGDDAKVATALTTSLGFYPPGTYVQLANGEKAVSVRRGPAANSPQVVSVINAQNLPLNIYITRATHDKAYAVVAPISFENLKLKVNAEKVQRAIAKASEARSTEPGKAA